jgi:hypothetical protein
VARSDLGKALLEGMQSKETPVKEYFAYETSWVPDETQIIRETQV